MRRLFYCGILSLLLGNLATAERPKTIDCEESSPLCAERFDNKNYEGEYVGHDEPSLLFYSSVPGSGNSNIYRMTIPTEPSTPPQPDWYRRHLQFSIASRLLVWHGPMR